MRQVPTQLLSSSLRGMIRPVSLLFIFLLVVTISGKNTNKVIGNVTCEPFDVSTHHVLVSRRLALVLSRARSFGQCRLAFVRIISQFSAVHFLLSSFFITLHLNRFFLPSSAQATPPTTKLSRPIPKALPTTCPSSPSWRSASPPSTLIFASASIRTSRSCFPRSEPMKMARESESRRSRRNAIERSNFARPLLMLLVSILVAVVCEKEQVASPWSHRLNFECGSCCQLMFVCS